MNLEKSRFIELIKTFKFKELFNELGWDKASISLPVNVEEENYTLTAVAEKRGFLIFVCSPNSSGNIATKDIRKKIDNKIAKVYFEHLIIYHDGDNSHQIWQLVIREQDKPIIVRETDYFSTQHPELLFQKLRGIFISLDDEDKVTIADVRANVKEQFNTNAERVTKNFYSEFKSQHTAFLKFIKGIEDNVSKEWYASLMLNRLMFIYFIQKKGFLDNNPNYLRDKLYEIQRRKGKDKFFSFYRNFLLVLFRKGLGSPERSEELKKELGRVPYLNGGLFDVHQIEKQFTNIEIDDKAFEKIFNFFDEYNWHLDTRITATGKDINPDVIGYIFEKYINDRAAMGAYYTKEDITEYIAKNTIIPFLFDQVKKDCANAFKDESSIWKMLRENPDKYIYDTVKHGVNLTPHTFLQEGNMEISQTSQKSLASQVPSHRGDLGVFDKENLEVYRNQIRPIPKWYEIPYNKNLVMTARELRKAGNKAEIILWLQVKNKQILGLDFDRQKVVGNFIVDFYCKDLAVAVEIDGSSHNDKIEYDFERDNFLKSVGLIVIHYTDIDVLNNIEGVIEDLKLKLIEIAKLSGVNLTPLTPLQEGNIKSLKNEDSAASSDKSEINLTPPAPLQEWNLGIRTTNLESRDPKVPSDRGDLGVFEDIDLDDPNHLLWKNFPDEIKQGFRPDLKDQIVVADNRPHLWEIRKEWNKPAPSDVALPTEIWREVIERHKRYFEIRKKISNGEIKEINDFITYNLNIRQFAQDAVEQYEGSDFINAFYKGITKITVLDPTCGSGAFLFAALNILEPLYYACIERMKGFIEQDDLQGGKKFTQFRKIIDEIKKHPSQQYYIYKSIILSNLYGVDIMNEAVEIAKLRLFLKLVAEVDEFEHLEPLPDIDFNIRAGNTLIGYANRKEIEQLEGLFVTEAMKKKIYDECDVVARAFTRFKEIQLENYNDKTEFNNAKQELNQRLNSLKQNLDKILHKQHYEGVEYNHWLDTHKPFHWFAEFYEIIESGGFDVIIGNPPYVVYTRKISKNQESVADRFRLKNYKTINTNNLYSFCIERSYFLQNNNAKFGMVLPFGSTSTPNMIDLVKLIRFNRGIWISNFDERPNYLFSGVCLQTSILLSFSNAQLNYTTKLIHWGAEQRYYLFEYFNYELLEDKHFIELPQKLNNNSEKRILGKISINRKLSNFFTKASIHKAYYKSAGGRYFKIFTDFVPKFSGNGVTASTAKKEIFFSSKSEKEIAIGAYSSSLFYWFWRLNSDCRNLTTKEINSFPLDLKLISEKKSNKIIKNVNDLLIKLKSNSIRKSAIYETSGSLSYQEFRPKLTKFILDEIDTVLAEHYGFTEEELDFIINYDIKYRMGKQNGEDE